MKTEHLCLSTFLIAMLIFPDFSDGKKVVIHVPYHVKKIKHTHTIYKVIPHHFHEEKKYDLLDNTDHLDSIEHTENSAVEDTDFDNFRK